MGGYPQTPTFPVDIRDGKHTKVVRVGGTAVAIDLDDSTFDNASLAPMAGRTIKLNAQTEAAQPQDATPAQAKTLLSLDQVENTSDASKPVSTAQATALSRKQGVVTRNQIAALTVDHPSIVVTGENMIGDYGAGARYVPGASGGWRAIQAATGTWYVLDPAPHAQNVQWWGIVGDRTTDDTAALRYMVNCLVGKGYVVTGKDVKIRLTSQINVLDSITFRGNYHASLPKADDATYVRYADADPRAYNGLIFYIDFNISFMPSGNYGIGTAGDFANIFNGNTAAFFVQGMGVEFLGVEFQCNQTPVPTQGAVSGLYTTTSGSKVVSNIPSTAGVQAGWRAYGPGIPGFTSVASVDSATQITLNNNATLTSTQSSVFFTPNWAPAERAWAIRTHSRAFRTDGQGIQIRNVMLRNLTYGICLFGSPQCVLQDIKGQCFKNMLSVTRCGDVCTFRGLWNGWTYWNGHTALFKYQETTCTAFRIGRFDGGCIYDLFSFYNRVTLHFFQDVETNPTLYPGQDGASTRTRVFGLYCDGSVIGVLSDDTASWDAYGMTFYGVLTEGGGRGVQIRDLGGYPQASYVRLVNPDFQGAAGQCVLAQRKSVITIESPIIRSWNVPVGFVQGSGSNPNGSGSAAFQGDTASTKFQISNATFVTEAYGADLNNPYGGYGGPKFGGTATFIQTEEVRGQVLAVSGYRLTKSGFAEQWGILSVGGTGLASVTFVVPFTACFGIDLNLYAVGRGTNYQYQARADAWTNTGFDLVCTVTGGSPVVVAPTNGNVNWRAIGQIAEAM